MKAKITKEGVLIPKEMLEGIPGEEVEIRKEPGKVIVLPAEDPILGLGKTRSTPGCETAPSITTDIYGE